MDEGDEQIAAMLEALQIEAADIAAFADVHAGYALTLESRDREPDNAGGEASDTVSVSAGDDRRLLAAGSSVLAASHRSLIDPRQSASDYELAADLFRDLDRAYHVILSICSGDDERIVSGTRAAAESEEEDVTLALLLGTAWGEASSRRREPRQSAERWSDSVIADRRPVGRLGLPYSAYARVVVGTTPHVGDAGAVEAVAEFLRRAAEPVHGAMHDTRHWRALYSAILPAEPELVAACRVALRRLRRWGDAAGVVDQVRRRVNDPIAFVPLQVAANLEGPDDLRSPAAQARGPLPSLDAGPTAARAVDHTG